MDARKILCLIITACAAASLSACGIRAEATYLRIVVTVRVCPPSSSDCYDLRVPAVDVAAVPAEKRTGPAITGTTDGAGEIKLKVEPGEYTITATSFALKDREITSKVSTDARKTKDVTLTGDLVPLT